MEIVDRYLDWRDSYDDRRARGMAPMEADLEASAETAGVG
jgi:hypothetical protein